MIPKYRFYSKRMKKMGVVISLKPFRNRVYVEWSDNLSGTEVVDDKGILMQSTGLFDTNCLDELFDGDVIYWKYYDSDWSDSGKAQIIFKNGSWKLLDVKTNEEVWDNLYVCLENCNVFKKGNIYENPELLESVEE